ncbi:thioesterase [Gammaproteobacteria bacterium 53_120_T64]|nr:thioesterase [Gammaproteobacteria bacterium 53_120_T64]
MSNSNAPIWHKPLSLDVLNNDFPDGAATNSGIEYTDFGADFITARMPVDERTRQPYGILHGGASCLLAETVGSHASSLCLDMTKQYCVGLEINANHIRSVTEGFVYGTAKPLHLGRSTHVWDIMIRTEAGKTVCISRLTMMIKDQ